MNYTIRVHVALVLHQQLHEMKHVIKGTTNAKKLMAFPFPFQNLPHKLQYNEKKKKTNPLNDTNKKKKERKNDCMLQLSFFYAVHQCNDPLKSFKSSTPIGNFLTKNNSPFFVI